MFLNIFGNLFVFVRRKEVERMAVFMSLLLLRASVLLIVFLRLSKTRLRSY